jgi:hypothetical protein
MEKKTSSEWNNGQLGFKVIDPDGWHRDERFEQEWYYDLITEEEFRQKSLTSTLMWFDGEKIGG